MERATPLTLYGRPGWGSAIIEAQLDWYGRSFRFIEVGDLLADPAAQTALGPLNPVAQVPTLVLADASVMTESAAITLWLADGAGADSLVPPEGAAERVQFLRWLVFIVAQIYPIFTFADVPGRYVTEVGAEAGFRERMDDRLCALWRMLEAAASAPWFLGARFSALDIYIAQMSWWRPKRAWFAANAPKLHALALNADAEPRLASAWARQKK